MICRSSYILVVAWMVGLGLVAAADARAQAVDYLGMVQDYVDVMINHGRDTYGPQHSPLFASAMERVGTPSGNPQLLAQTWAKRVEVEQDWGYADYRKWRPYHIEGIRGGDRAVSGGNVGHDQPLYELLYRLADRTGDSSYAQQADSALSWWLSNTQSPATKLMAWGEHTSWDFATDQRTGQYNFNWNDVESNPYGSSYEHATHDLHEFFDNFRLWERCLALNGSAVRDFAQGLWDNQIDNKNTGSFSRHAHYSNRWTDSGKEYPRHGGFYIETWARSYASTSDEEFGDQMLDAINALVDGFEHRRSQTSGNYIPAGAHSMGTYWGVSTLELAIQSHTAAGVIDDQATADRLLALGEYVDDYYLNSASPSEQDFGHNLWAKGYGRETDANTALYCIQRYQQTGKAEYLNLALAAADGYLDSDPNDAIGDTRNSDEQGVTDGSIYHLYPGALADAIDLMVEAYALTDDSVYLQRADWFGEQASNLFFDGASALPTASQRHDHYEAITGGPDLMLSLQRLGEVVPEPTSMLVLGAGAVMLAGRRGRAWR